MSKVVNYRQIRNSRYCVQSHSVFSSLFSLKTALFIAFGSILTSCILLFDVPFVSNHSIDFLTSRRNQLNKFFKRSSNLSMYSTFTCANATQYLTKGHPVMGFHVLCFETTTATTTEETTTEATTATTTTTTFNVIAYRNGHFPAMELNNVHVESDRHLLDGRLKNKLYEILHVSLPTTEKAMKYQQLPAFFTVDGIQLDGNNVFELLAAKVVFLSEGGRFIWPGIEIGHKTHVRNVYDKDIIEMETLSMTPLVFSIDNFLSDNEIQTILSHSMDKLAPSGVSHRDGDEHRPATDWRTSATYFLSSKVSPTLQAIDQRISELVKAPIDHMEDVQVLRYQETQKYDQHTDYFPVDGHQKNPDILELIQHGYRNRMITVFWYMSDVEEGGHTIFPRSGGLPAPDTMNDCTKGLKVAPKKGKVIVFYSMLPNGKPDPMSLHGGCPVIKGLKYSGNKWVWNKPFPG